MVKPRRASLLFGLSIADLQPASTFTLDDDFAVTQAQFDLANVAARAVNLLGDHGRALRASARFALRDVAASMDAESLRFGIKVGLKH